MTISKCQMASQSMETLQQVFTRAKQSLARRIVTPDNIPAIPLHGLFLSWIVCKIFLSAPIWQQLKGQLPGIPECILAGLLAIRKWQSGKYFCCNVTVSLLPVYILFRWPSRSCFVWFNPHYSHCPLTPNDDFPFSADSASSLHHSQKLYLYQQSKFVQ